jgi:hypothetical protein
MIQTKANNAYCEGNLRRISSLVTEKSACLKWNLLHKQKRKCYN